MTERTELIGLTRVDCLQLLAAGGLGRVVFTASAMPAVQPVRYVLRGEEVVFQVVDGDPLSMATQHAVVGFQVDDIDPVTHAGWSVLGVGQAYEISDADRRSVPVAGSATHAVAVPLQQLTGQRVRLGYTGAAAAGRPAAAARTVSC
jgi:nitroimidazol reductase NimA-like FMN-containing flavoprotein (pyridoxamine 5'-phosphate oxidase superfamily)